jgi:hypothetical protein
MIFTCPDRKASLFRRVYSLEKTKVQLALVELDFHFTPVNIRFVQGPLPSG